MFTGIVRTIGKIEAVEPGSPAAADLRLHVAAKSETLGLITAGDSVAVNGVCLTATSTMSNGFVADVSEETIACTALGRLKRGTRVNLEPAVTPSTLLGGHLVSGHVDGVGEITGRSEASRSLRIQIRAPESLAKYIAPKGSITVDGVSLTVNEVSGTMFDVNIVPHTLEVTIIGDYQEGDAVNLEVDLVARYLERLLKYTGPGG